MVPYLILLLIPSIFALLNVRRLSLLLWYTTFVIYVVFVGLRYKVGPDWVQYGFIHTSLAYYGFWDMFLRPEPLSYLLFWISEALGLHVYLSNFVAAVILMIGVLSFARRTASPWLALVAATPYFIVVVSMSGIRQSMAAGIVLFLLSRWERYSFIRRGIYILIAALFHTSALANNILLVAKLNITLRYKLVIGALVLLMTIYLSSEVSLYADSMVQYRQRYLQSSYVVESFGSLFHIAMIAIPALLGFIYKKRIAENIYSSSLLDLGLYASLGVLMINFFSTTVASRLTIYLYFVPMMVYPALVDAFGKRTRLAALFAIIAVHFLIMGVWFTLGNVAFAYIPYQNILFDD